MKKTLPKNQQKKHNFFVSFVFAWRGIVWNIIHERNMRFHFITLLLASIFGFFFRITVVEWLILLLFFALVPTAELFNSAIEETNNTLRDRLHLDYPTTKNARDLAAGAVLWSSIFALITGIVIFAPHFINLFATLFA